MGLSDDEREQARRTALRFLAEAWRKKQLYRDCDNWTRRLVGVNGDTEFKILASEIAPLATESYLHQMAEHYLRNTKDNAAAPIYTYALCLKFKVK